MDEYIAGIDIGTSSVKILCINQKGESYKTAQSYDPEAFGATWWEAILLALESMKQFLDLHLISAIGLTAQVGTYILYTPEKEAADLVTISWRDKAGEEELKELKRAFSKEHFIKHISMRHPDLISYPVPRIMWLQKNKTDDWNTSEKLLQPKDLIYHRLTGVFASDAYSWRGLSNLEDFSFHRDFLDELGIPKDKLPDLFNPAEAPGIILTETAAQLGVKAGIPVFVGCNDFFASLVGMGVTEQGQCFDMTGTSEHIGIISSKLEQDSSLISGPFFNDFIHYGVTGNSGTSMSWALKNFGSGTGWGNSFQPPLFLPYLLGERAPIWDSKARGVFFGLESRHNIESLMYSVLEGVVFSLYHIWCELKEPVGREFRVAGGAAFDDGLNQMKANLFQTPFAVMRERESAALGAVIFAGLGMRWFPSLEKGAETWVSVDHIILPDATDKSMLLARFEIYKGLYPVLKDSFIKWNDCLEANKDGI